MPIGLLTLEIHIPDARSLKDKRQVLRSLKDRLRAHFNVAVAELEHQELWQRSRVGVVSISGDGKHLEDSFQAIAAESERILGRDLVSQEIDTLRNQNDGPGASFERGSREEIRNEVTLMLAGELKDPRLALPLIVTEVRVAPGMRSVRVFVQLEGDDAERAAALKGLKAAAGFVRHELVERLNLRRAPEIIFIPDQSEEYGQRIDNLLQKVNRPEKS